MRVLEGLAFTQREKRSCYFIYSKVCNKHGDHRPFLCLNASKLAEKALKSPCKPPPAPQKRVSSTKYPSGHRIHWLSSYYLNSKYVDSGLPLNAPGQSLEGAVYHHGQQADQHRALQYVGGVEAAQAHDDGRAEGFGTDR